MSLITWDKGTHFKHDEVPSTVARKQRKKDRKQRLQDAYDEVDERDGMVCQATGKTLQRQHMDAEQVLTHHHLAGRNVKPEWRHDADRIITVSLAAHRLITAGWIVVEGDDARQAIRCHWAAHVRPEMRPFRLKSRRRSQ